jgi:tRNA modification GTPase
MTPSVDHATYLACLTPAGKGAVATLALRGPQAWKVACALFQPASASHPLPAEPKPGRFWLGRLGETGRGAQDEVVLAVIRTGPPPWLEVHCHGGPEVLRLLEEVFAGRGVSCCSWQELEQRTAASKGKATALAALVEAPTVRTAAILLDQYHGAFGRAVAAIRAALERNDQAEAGRLLNDLARHALVGQHLTVPWRVVVAGAPNVGKSSLVNLLAGFPRSLVAPTPGTTRDVVTVQIAVDGWPVELCDTAGWREAAESLEQQGIDLARGVAARADLCLWVLDASTKPVWPTATTGPVHTIINKTDLVAGWDLTRATDALRVSAHTGAGKEDLYQALSRWLVPDPPPPGAALPFTSFLAERVTLARQRWHERKVEEVLAILDSMGEERR